MNEFNPQQQVVPPIKPPITIKKEIKRSINYIVGGLLLYEIIMIIAMILYSLAMVLSMALTNHDYDYDELINHLLLSLEKSGAPYLIAILIGIPLLLLYYWTIHPQKIKKLFISKSPMNAKTFFLIFIVFMSSQGLFAIIGAALEAFFNLFHLSVLDALEEIPQSSTLSMFLYVSFLGPITEELIFRGLILRKLQKYGTLFAIIVSSILFGAFHGNLAQGLFATFIGFIFAYVAIEYSISWAILLHIINNFIFCEALSFITSGLNPAIQDLISNTLFGGFLISSIIILVLYRKHILTYIHSHRTQKRFYGYAFTSCVMILFFIIQAITGILSIQSI